ncbi:MAG: peptidylprolyl isomerase [candidate division KSB1 bacterium]|nr:peptidylprolyl isomerase [candidate division KSB1 bacterium]
MRHASLHLVGVGLLGLALLGCEEFTSPFTVGRVGNARITLGEFRDHYRVGRDPEALRAVSMDARRTHLERMLEARMKYLEAKRLGLDQDSAYVARYREVRDRAVMEEMMREKILYRLIPASEVRRWYKYSGTAVKVKSISIYVREGMRPRELLAKGSQAWQVYTRLKRGEPFDSLVVAFSEDPAERDSGGNPRWIRWGFHDPRLCLELFKLEKGEFSRPIRTPEGYRVFQVVEKNVVETLPLRLIRFEVLSQIRNTDPYRRRVDAELEKFITSVMGQYRYAENAFAWNYLSGVMKIRKAALISGQVSGESDQFEMIPQAHYHYALCRWKGDSLTIGEVIDYVRKNSARTMPDFTDERTRRSWIEGIARRKLLTQHAYELGYDRHPDVQEQLRNYELRVLPTVLDNRLVRQKAEVTEEQARRFFEAHRNEFKIPASRLVREILIGNYDLAEEIARRAKGGEDFLQLARKYNERQSTKNQDGLLGWVTEGAFGELGTRAVQMSKGEISNPIPVGNKWSVIRIEDERAERLKTYEEARTQVMERARSEQQLQLARELSANLRKSYRPVVYERALARAFPLP